MLNPVVDYLVQLNAVGPIGRAIDHDEERQLLRRAVAGDEAARWEVVRMNIPLAVSIAARCAARFPWFDASELLSEGTHGIYIAAGRFDVARTCNGKPVCFSTYAMPWIRQTIARYVKGRGAAAGTAPRDRDLATPLADPIESAESAAIGREDRDRLAVARGELAERERVVLECRFGIGRDRMKLYEVGRKLGISRERVRQIEVKAIAKLRRRMVLEEAPSSPEKPAKAGRPRWPS